MAITPYRGCVYIATCATNGKIYIGKSKLGLSFRRRSHLRSAKRSSTIIFSAALIKYGPASFEWQEIFCSDDDEELLAAERALIADYRAAGFVLYNLTDGGEGSAGRRISLAQYEKMKGLRHTEDAKRKMRDAWPPERRAAHAAKMAARLVSQTTLERSSLARLGKKLSPEHCKAMGDGRRGIKMKPWTEDRRAKVAATWATKRR